MDYSDFQMSVDLPKAPVGVVGDPVALFQRLGGFAHLPVTLAMMILGVVIYLVCMLQKQDATGTNSPYVPLLTYQPKGD
jgi:hypothetical protein